MINKVGIIGGSYSGSTLLGAMLSGHSKIFYPGELYYHFACKPLLNSHCRKCCFLKQKCPLVDDPLFNATVVDQNIHEALLQYSKAQVIVDGSKRPIWFQRFIKDHKRWLIIHLIKSPEAFVASSISRGPSERRTLDQAIKIWIRDLKRSVKLMKHYEHSFCLQYEHFVQHPKAVVNFITRKAGLEVEPGLDKYWNFDTHFLGGNNSVTTNFDGCENIIPHTEPVNQKMYKAKHRKIFLDEKWKRVLTKEQLEIITRKTAPFMKLVHPNMIKAV